MGRNKIKIERIESERKRTATYTKRSHGLIKKAMELSILCDCEVSLFIFTNEKLVVYSSREVKDTLIKFVEFKSNYYSYSNADVRAARRSPAVPVHLPLDVDPRGRHGPAPRRERLGHHRLDDRHQGLVAHAR